MKFDFGLKQTVFEQIWVKSNCWVRVVPLKVVIFWLPWIQWQNNHRSLNLIVQTNVLMIPNAFVGCVSNQPVTVSHCGVVKLFSWSISIITDIIVIIIYCAKCLKTLFRIISLFGNFCKILVFFSLGPTCNDYLLKNSQPLSIWFMVHWIFFAACFATIFILCFIQLVALIRNVRYAWFCCYQQETHPVFFLWRLVPNPVSINPVSSSFHFFVLSLSVSMILISHFFVVTYFLSISTCCGSSCGSLPLSRVLSDLYILFYSIVFFSNSCYLFSFDDTVLGELLLSLGYWGISSVLMLVVCLW
jgi:hypothetical protein